MGESADGSCDEDVINSWRFPKINAWVERFKQVYAKAVKEHGKLDIISVEDAKSRILESDFAELEGNVDLCDPMDLTKGQLVEIRPTDFGSTHVDRGQLISLCSREAVVAVKIKDGDGYLRLHYPRMGFKITVVDEEKPTSLRWLCWFKECLQSVFSLSQHLWTFHVSKRMV